MSVPVSRYIWGRLPWYGVLIVLGAALAVLIASKEEKKVGLPEDTIIDLALRVLPLGIVGARLYYVLFSLDRFRMNPVSIFYIWEGGLAIYGGLIFGGLTVFFFCKKRNLPILKVLDIIVPGLALAQAIGRWGNYFNQEAYGLKISNPFFQIFPVGVQIAENGTLVWHLATFFMESCLNLFIFFFLIWGRRKLFRREGDPFLIYGLLYASGRLIIENFRMDSLYLGSHIRVSQLLSVLLCMFILGLFFFRRFLKDSRKLTTSKWFFIIVTILDGVAAVLYCFGYGTISISSFLSQTIFLSVYSFLSVLTAFLFYGRSNSAEVCYANH